MSRNRLILTFALWSGIAAVGCKSRLKQGAEFGESHGKEAAGADKMGLLTPTTSTMPQGAWSAPVAWKPPGRNGKFIAIHQNLLPNGKLLVWAHEYDYLMAAKAPTRGTPSVFTWDPVTGAFGNPRIDTANLFCSGHAFLPDGRVFVVGGHAPGTSNAYRHGLAVAEAYDYRTDTWTHMQKMLKGRYYGSAITLGSGEILAVTGRDQASALNKIPEVWNQNTGWRELTNASTAAYPDYYHYIYQLSDGRVFGATHSRKSYFMTTTGTGTLTPGPSFAYTRRYYATSVMYDDDKILLIGGNAAAGTAGSGADRLITETVESIDLTSPTPAWKYEAPMAFRRWHANATILADGNVLVTGGTGGQTEVPGSNGFRSAVYPTEMWSPDTKLWTKMASMSVPRLYHSTAILLPDARVLVAGGGAPGSTGEPTNAAHQDMQIFSPPYLFAGPRPTIAEAPEIISYGQSFTVSSPDASNISKVNLIRLGSVTHSFNMNQRIKRLQFTADATSLQVVTPANRNSLPPGHYMMFLINTNGVPSVAKIVQVQ